MRESACARRKCQTAHRLMRSCTIVCECAQKCMEACESAPGYKLKPKQTYCPIRAFTRFKTKKLGRDAWELKAQSLRERKTAFRACYYRVFMWSMLLVRPKALCAVVHMPSGLVTRAACLRARPWYSQHAPHTTSAEGCAVGSRGSNSLVRQRWDFDG